MHQVPWVVSPSRQRWLRLFLSAAVGFYVGMAASGVGEFPFAYAHTGCPSDRIDGTPGDDTLLGDGNGDPAHDHDDFIDGAAGNDLIRGYTCGDSLIGGGGPDNIHGAFGNDTILGGDGSDHPNVCGLNTCGELIGGDGDDYFEGNMGSDMPDDDTSSDADELHGGNDDDDVDGSDGDGQDSIFGGSGTDDCWKDTGDSTSDCESIH